jgi:5-methylthioadenosine/S-adenosylhomocysteine deaminase
MILIKNGYVITMDDYRTVYTNGGVVIDGQKIIEVGKSEDLEKKYPYTQIINARGKAVLPGLINTHTHLFQTLYRGLGDDMTLADWLAKMIWPLSYHLGKEESHVATLLSSAEMIRNGVTTFVDSHYIHRDKLCIDRIVEAADEIGIRGVIGRTTINAAPAPESFWESIETAQKESARVIETYHGASEGRITVRVEPLNETLATPEMIKAIWEVSKQYGVGMNMHLAETALRVKSVQDRFGISSIEYLHDLGVLGPNLLLAHCVWITKKEIHLLQSTNTKVVHNAVANQYLAEGIAPVAEMLRKGITVCLGTDGAASNNNLDIFGAMKSSVLLQKVNEMDTLALTAENALEMVTINAAKALNMEHEIGSLEAGKKADIILVDLNRPEMVPSVSIISNLVYSASGSVINTVIIDGKIVMNNREITTVDEQLVLDKANSTVRDMMNKSNLWNLVNKNGWSYI